MTDLTVPTRPLDADILRATGAAIAADLADNTGAADIGFSQAGSDATLGSLQRKGREWRTPEDYGAVGDGVADDLLAVQKAINSLPVGGELRFLNTYNLGGGMMSLVTAYVTFRGPGGIVNGGLRIGPDTLPSSTSRDLRITITGMSFDGSPTFTGPGSTAINGIELQNARRVSISKNRFINYHKAVTSIRYTDEAFHRVSMVRIIDNDFTNVNYAFYVACPTGSAWQNTNDCAFVDNTINFSYITGVYCEGIDGIHVNDNVFFTVAYSSTDTTLKGMKEHNIRIGTSDWVIITNNNLFEAGYESIVLDAPKHFSIKGNLCAWPGQREPRSAVKLSGLNQPMGVIEGNTFSRFSKHAIEIATNLGSGSTTTVCVRNNVVEYDAATPSYYGSTALNSFTHYNVYSDPTTFTLVSESGSTIAGGVGNSLRDSPQSRVTLGEAANGVGGARFFKTVTASTIFKVALLNPAILGTPVSGRSYAGLLVITARQNLNSNPNTASYLVHVSCSGGTAVLALISELGLTTGGAASHPSFTFSIDGTTFELRATPKGSTAGDFYFDITAVGNLSLWN